MQPTTVIYAYEAAQGIVEERIAQARKRDEIHRMMQESRARRQFHRTIVDSLRRGLGADDLAAELRTALRTTAQT